MKELFDVVLSGVAKKDLLVLLKNLESHSECVADVEASEVLGIEDSLGFDKKMIAEFCAFEGDICVVAKLYGFDIVSTCSDFFVLLRIVKHGEEVDVELCFDNDLLTDVEKVMLSLQKYIQGVTDRVHIMEFYGGMEPAQDLETRYFTNDMLGHLAVRSR